MTKSRNTALIESELIDVELGMGAVELLSAAQEDAGSDRHKQIAPGALDWAIEKLRLNIERLRAAYEGSIVAQRRAA